MPHFDMNHWEFCECPEWRQLPRLKDQLKPLRLPKTAAYKFVTEVILDRDDSDRRNAGRRELWARRHDKTTHRYLDRL